ncbi:hypothetical protein JCM11491_001832 [Sporobolomyces phaffii]
MTRRDVDRLVLQHAPYPRTVSTDANRLEFVSPSHHVASSLEPRPRRQRRRQTSSSDDDDDNDDANEVKRLRPGQPLRTRFLATAAETDFAAIPQVPRRRRHPDDPDMSLPLRPLTHRVVSDREALRLSKSGSGWVSTKRTTRPRSVLLTTKKKKKPALVMVRDDQAGHSTEFNLDDPPIRRHRPMVKSSRSRRRNLKPVEPPPRPRYRFVPTRKPRPVRPFAAVAHRPRASSPPPESELLPPWRAKLQHHPSASQSLGPPPPGCAAASKSTTTEFRFVVGGPPRAPPPRALIAAFGTDALAHDDDGAPRVSLGGEVDRLRRRDPAAQLPFRRDSVPPPPPHELRPPPRDPPSPDEALARRALCPLPQRGTSRTNPTLLRRLSTFLPRTGAGHDFLRLDESARDAVVVVEESPPVNEYADSSHSAANRCHSPSPGHHHHSRRSVPPAAAVLVSGSYDLRRLASSEQLFSEEEEGEEEEEGLVLPRRGGVHPPRPRQNDLLFDPAAAAATPGCSSSSCSFEGPPDAASDDTSRGDAAFAASSSAGPRATAGAGAGAAWWLAGPTYSAALGPSSRRTTRRSDPDIHEDGDDDGLDLCALRRTTSRSPPNSSSRSSEVRSGQVGGEGDETEVVFAVEPVEPFLSSSSSSSSSLSKGAMDNAQEEEERGEEPPPTSGIDAVVDELRRRRRRRRVATTRLKGEEEM